MRIGIGAMARTLLVAVFCLSCSGCLVAVAMSATGAMIRHAALTSPSEGTYSIPAGPDPAFAAALSVLSKGQVVETSDATTRTIVATDKNKYWRYTVNVQPAASDQASQMNVKVVLAGNWDDGHVGNIKTSDRQAAFISELSSQLGGVEIRPTVK